jgi:SOS response associated peptidase (SRAP)
MATFNARAETVETKPVFRDAFKRSRCLIPMSGYYEWQNTPSGKQSFFCYSPRVRHNVGRKTPRFGDAPPSTHRSLMVQSYGSDANTARMGCMRPQLGMAHGDPMVGMSFGRAAHRCSPLCYAVSIG